MRALQIQAVPLSALNSAHQGIRHQNFIAAVLKKVNAVGVRAAGIRETS
jgi:hypothetical protein